MPRHQTRREILRVGSPAASLVLAGCSSLSFSPFDCPDSHSAVIKAEPVNLSSNEANSVDPIIFSELPKAEQAIVRKAIKDGVYRVCPAASSADWEELNSFADRTLKHGKDNVDTYLKFEGEYYRLRVRIEDLVYT